MILTELAKLRKFGARPADPVHITDCYEVHEWCTKSDIPCLYLQDLKAEVDYRPMFDLDVVVVGRDCVPNMERLRDVRPRSAWFVGYYGWKDFVCKS